MLRALWQLLLRGGLSVSVCAFAALSISGFLSLIATSLQPKPVAQTIASRSCKLNHCRPKPGGGHQVLAAKVR